MNKSKFVLMIVLAFILGASTSPVISWAGTTFFSTTQTVSGRGSTTCPYGFKLSGGGVDSLPSDSFGSYSSQEYKLTGSFPSSNGWRATAEITRGSYTSNFGWKFSSSGYSPTVYAV